MKNGSNVNEHLEAIADNRHLRQTLADLLDILGHWTGAPKARVEYYEQKILAAVRRRNPPGPGRFLLVYELTPATTRADVERSIAAALDQLFAGGALPDGSINIRTLGDAVVDEKEKVSQGDENQHRSPKKTSRRIVGKGRQP